MSSLNQNEYPAAQWELITPQEAAKSLERAYPLNRPVNYDVKEQYRRDIEDGNWLATGEPIIFDSDGYLANGHTRLTACIDAGKPFVTLVVHGVSPDSRIAMDDVRRRTFANNLHMTGHQWGSQQETLLKGILTWENYGGFALRVDNQRKSNKLLAVVYPTYGHDMVQAIMLTNDYARKIPGPNSALYFAAWLLLRYGPEKRVRKFFSILAIGSQEWIDHPVVTLREKLASDKEDKKVSGRRVYTAEIIYFMIRAWNAWNLGDKMTKYQLPTGGLRNPYPTPVTVENGA
jgi:hypothetical protein